MTRFSALISSLILLFVTTGCGGSGALVDTDILPRPSLSGRVMSPDGEPIPGAKVFVSGTTLRATTTSQGRFTLAEVPPGSHEVVAYQPGRVPATVRVTHAPKSSETVDIELPSERLQAQSDTARRADTGPGSSDMALADELSPAAQEIISSLRQRLSRLEAALESVRRQVGLLRDTRGGATELAASEETLETFKRYFLGEDREKCRLVNPGELSFGSTEAESGVRLRASSRQPLEVVNRRLGYRLRVDVEDFRVVEAGDGNRVQDDLHVSFEPLAPDNADMAKRWRNARQEAHEGSHTHLMQALAARKPKDEGFTLDRNARVEGGATGSAYQGGGARGRERWLPLDDVGERVSFTETPYVRQLLLNGEYKVSYETLPETWRIEVRKNARFTVLGHPMSAEGIKTSRYRSVRPVCRLVPTDYLPSE